MKSQPLLDEILALGGDKEDLALLENVDTDDNDADFIDEDDEGEQANPAPKVNEKTLKNELKKLMANMGFDKISREQHEASDESEPEDAAPPAAIKQEPKIVQQPLQIASDVPLKTQRKGLLLEPTPSWFAENITFDTSGVDMLPADQKLPLVHTLRDIGRKVLENEGAIFLQQKQKKSSSEYQWFTTVIKTGTLSDRVSALTLAILESPLHNIAHIETIMNMAKKKTKREAILAIESIKDVLLGQGAQTGGLLPADRKLKFFQEQPYLDAVIAKLSKDNTLRKFVTAGIDIDKIPVMISKSLAKWYFEDYVKSFYYQWILLLDGLSKDPQVHIKIKVVSMAWELLTNKPEQERTLLTFIINKFGDLDKKLSSKVGFLLQKLLESHPQMKLAVVKEVEVFIHRAGLSDKAQYYALIFLNQINFGKAMQDAIAARYCCEIYFKLFQSLVESLKGKQEAESEVDSKLMASILTGISRAFPFACSPVAVGGMDLSMVSAAQKHIYQANYGENIESQLTSLFRVVHLGDFSFSTAVQALQVLFQIVFQKNVEDGTFTAFSASLSSRYYRSLYSTMESPRLADSAKPHGLYLNLVYKSLKANLEAPCFTAMMKRLLQTVISGHVAADSAFPNAAFVVISESLRESASTAVQSTVRKLIVDGAEAELAKYGDEDEHFDDVVSEDGEQQPAEAPLEKPVAKNGVEGYNPFHRSPEFALANENSIWELALLAQHYHPTTRLFARTMLFEGKPKESIAKENNFIVYPSDPLQDFSIARFLDKFVYRNPKTAKHSQQEPMRRMQKPTRNSTILRKPLHRDRTREQPITSKDWKHKSNHAKIPVDEEFFVEYFGKKTPKEDAPEKAARDSDDDEFDEFEDDLDEDEVNAAIMGSSGNGLDVGDDGEDDIDFADEDEGASEAGELGGDNLELGDDFDGGDFEDEEEALDDDFGSAEEMGSDEDEVDDDDVLGGFEFQQADSSSEAEMSGQEDAANSNDSDDDDDSEVEHAEKLKKKKAQKQAVRAKLNGTENGKPKKNLNLALKGAVQKAKKENASAGVFASMDDYAHLLQDPDFHDSYWNEEKKVVEDGDGKSRGKSHGAKSGSKRRKPSTESGAPRKKGKKF